jgi:signal transduction histidine kinase
MGKVRGCAFLCDENGVVNDVLRDDFSVVANVQEGRLFTSLFEKDSLGEALNLMTEIKTKNAAFDYRLNIKHNNTVHSLYFLGISLIDKMLLVGADNHTEAVEFTNHLHTINNEQANFIRSLLKEKNQIQRSKDAETEELLEQLTSVNNDLINLQRKLNKQKNELERLNEIKNRFMGIASHDLRNPLNVVQLYSEFLVEEGNSLSEEHLSFAKAINDASQFMIRLVNDLLEFSKIDSGNIQLSIQEFDIIKTCSGIIDLLKPIARNKNINLTFKPTVSALTVSADLFKIEQVLNNLVGNAVKFSYFKTDIVITISKEGNDCLISIENKGDGIKPEDIDKLFKPFQKIAFHGTNNESGSGLGLFIVKQIVDNHKGSTWVESILKEKTTFFVRLPINANT